MLVLELTVQADLPRLQSFLPPFRTHVAPFYPVIPNFDELELAMHRLLDDVESDSPTKHSAKIALSLSVLAIGAQFADVPIQLRETQSQNLST